MTQKQFKTQQSRETRDTQTWQSRDLKKITQPRSLIVHTVTITKYIYKRWMDELQVTT